MPVNAPNDNLNLKASNFKLISVDDNFYSLDQLRGLKGTVVAFLSNHCPYVIKIAQRLSFEAEELKKIDVSTIGIMSNNVEVYPEDSFENMKKFSIKNNFNFQYLYDKDQSVAKKYNAVCTPDFYGFNKDLELKYRGRIDSTVMDDQDDIKLERDLFYAMKSISLNNRAPKKQINSFGCSIKWF
jgi:peroxiredoxin